MSEAWSFSSRPDQPVAILVKLGPTPMPQTLPPPNAPGEPPQPEGGPAVEIRARLANTLDNARAKLPQSEPILVRECDVSRLRCHQTVSCIRRTANPRKRCQLRVRRAVSSLVSSAEPALRS